MTSWQLLRQQHGAVHLRCRSDICRSVPGLLHSRRPGVDFSQPLAAAVERVQYAELPTLCNFSEYPNHNVHIEHDNVVGAVRDRALFPPRAIPWQEFQIATGTGDERAKEAVARVGRAVFNGGESRSKRQTDR